MAETYRWQDLDFVPLRRAAEARGARWAAHAMTLAIAAFLVIFVVWAALSPLDEVTRGTGRVIPSSQLQTIQHLEGGIVSEILVREGQRVNVGDVLVRINSPAANAELRENLNRYHSLRAAVARLEAEAEGREPEWPADVPDASRQGLFDQQAEWRARQERQRAELAALRDQLEQRRQEIAENNSRAARAGGSLRLINEELNMAQQLLQQGAVSRVEVLRLQRQATELRGEIGQASAAAQRAQAALQEVQRRIQLAEANFRSEALRDLNQRRNEMAALREAVEARRDRVERTDVRSPVLGIVNRLAISTVGGVVQPGAEIVSIVPLDDQLLIEAQIRPQDIGFLRPGLEAMVKISAYDFAVYGGLPAAIEQISADTITDQQGNAFYRVRLRTRRAYLGTPDNPLPIAPGMQASVDILTGRKTVLDYLLHPILRAREVALRER